MIRETAALLSYRSIARKTGTIRSGLPVRYYMRNLYTGMNGFGRDTH